MSEDDPIITIDEPFMQPGGTSIRVVSRMTGLSVDTLRMWERRYGFPAPSRNGINNRVYSNEDLERLRLVAKAIKMGFRAGEAIRLPNASLLELVTTTPATEARASFASMPALEPLMRQIEECDPDGLGQALRREAISRGASAFVADIAAPLLDAVGTAWASGKLGIHQERLFTEVLSTQLRALGVELRQPQGPLVLLSTLARESHGLGLEMVAVMAATFGAMVHSLGTGVPGAEVVKAATALRPQALGLSISEAAPTREIGERLARLESQLPSTIELWLGGKGARHLEEPPPRARLLAGWEDLRLAVRGLVQRC